MRILSIKQPWAQLIVTGRKDIENRSWEPKHTGKILIHASSTKAPSTLFLKCIFEQGNEVMNEQLFGNLAQFGDLDYSAIVGYVTVNGYETESESVWANPGELQWKLEDAYIFDEPIRNVSGKLNLWNYPDLDESNLPPAHKFERKAPKREGTELFIPVGDDEDITIFEENQIVYLGVTDEILALVEKPESKRKKGDVFEDIKTIKLQSPKRTIVYEVDKIDCYTCNNPDGTPQMTVNWNMEEINYFVLGISFGKKVK